MQALSVTTISSRVLRSFTKSCLIPIFKGFTSLMSLKQAGKNVFNNSTPYCACSSQAGFFVVLLDFSDVCFFFCDCGFSLVDWDNPSDCNCSFKLALLMQYS